MFSNPSEISVTTVPFSRPPSPEPNGQVRTTAAKPVLALKELVASLYREQNKIQNLLSSLGFALRSFNNLNQFLEVTPLMAARVTEADGGMLILFKSNGVISLEQLHCQDNSTSQNLRQEIERIIRQFNLSNSQSVQPLSLSLPDSLDRQIRQSLSPQIQLYSTPVLVKNTERGRFYVFSFDPQYVWTQTRRKLLQLVADQTAVAISNNELTVELRSRERQDRELEIASEIQSRLLPRQCPIIQGLEIAACCKTANRVGGDYYDFIPTNYDQLQQTLSAKGESPNSSSVPWSILIGDVMGKGVPAGLIMTMARGMLRAEVLNRHSPAQVLEHLNRLMYADLENSHRFLTLFYSEYDPQTQILSYSNAAHHPPLLWQAQTNTIQRLDSEGMLIGLEPDSLYENAYTQLYLGDTIIYYTDGLTDAVSPNGDRFEEENLLRTFSQACQMYDSPQAILDYLFDQVKQFVGAENPNTDDITVVVMRVKSSR